MACHGIRMRVIDLLDPDFAHDRAAALLRDVDLSVTSVRRKGVVRVSILRTPETPDTRGVRADIEIAGTGLFSLMLDDRFVYSEVDDEFDSWHETFDLMVRLAAAYLTDLPEVQQSPNKRGRAERFVVVEIDDESRR